jgi:aerotaxis receptor
MRIYLFNASFSSTSEGTKGYLSCRRKASIEEIKTHENLYKQLKMNEKAA